MDRGEAAEVRWQRTGGGLWGGGRDRPWGGNGRSEEDSGEVDHGEAAKVDRGELVDDRGGP